MGNLLRGYVFDRGYSASLFFVNANLLYCFTEFPETLYGIKTHYVDVHITNKELKLKIYN